MEKLFWTTEKRKINDIVPYERNPRLISEEQIENLKKSIEKFDLVEIPAINIDNTLIAGHQRLKVMQLIGRGEEEIDVRVPSRSLSVEEFEEYLIRSNKNTGDWDWNLLSQIDSTLLKDIGFTQNELDIIFGLSDLIDYDKLKEELIYEMEETKSIKLYKLSTENFFKVKELAEKLIEEEKDLEKTGEIKIVKTTRIRVNEEQAIIINEALEKMKNNGITPISRALENICADFLGK